MPFIQGSIKNYHVRNLQVITVFDDGFRSGCYCEYKSKRIAHTPDLIISCCTKICHLHRLTREKSKDSKKDINESSLRRSKTMIQDYALSDYFEYFLTLTFDPKKVDSMNHELTKKLLSKWLNNLRRQHPDMKYVLVPELHKSGAIHFHGMFKDFDKDKLQLVPARNKKTNRLIRDKGNRQVFNMKQYGYGYSTVVELDDNPATAYYITKYIKKEMLQNAVLNKKRYWVSKNLRKSFNYTVSETKDITELNVHDLSVISVYKGKYYTRYTRSTIFDHINYTALPKVKKKRLIQSQSDSHASLVR